MHLFEHECIVLSRKMLLSLAASGLMTFVAGRAAHTLGAMAREAQSINASKTYTIYPAKRDALNNLCYISPQPGPLLEGEGAKCLTYLVSNRKFVDSALACFYSIDSLP